jgi:hypothetical protein
VYVAAQAGVAMAVAMAAAKQHRNNFLRIVLFFPRRKEGRVSGRRLIRFGLSSSDVELDKVSA